MERGVSQEMPVWAELDQAPPTVGCQPLEGGHQSQQRQCDIDLSGTDKNTQGIVLEMFRVQHKFNLYFS